MNITTDITVLMQLLGAYSYSPTTPSELAQKLQTMPGGPVDKIFHAIDLLYAFSDQLNAEGQAVLRQLTGHALLKEWAIPGQPGRLEGIDASVKRDMGDAGATQLVEDAPLPVLTYREDAKDWRSDVEPDIEALKASKRKAIAAMTVEKEDAGAPTPFGTAHSDADSRGKINGLVLMAMLAKQAGATFDESITLADESVIQLDANKTIGFGVAVGRHIAAVHTHARQLKDQIDAATTVEGVNAVDMAAGWP